MAYVIFSISSLIILALLIPVYNEEKSILPLLKEISSFIKIPIKLYFIYDSDNDPTVSVIENHKNYDFPIELIKNNYGSGALNAIKTGFETFSELFDESYDDIFDEDLRYKKVFSEIKRVCDMDVNKLNDLYHSVLIDKVIYNQNVYIDYDRKKHFNKFMKQFNWE